MTTPERILIVRLSHLGDVVCALPLFHALTRAYPQAEIGWAVQPEFADLLEGLRGLSRIFAFDRRGGLGAWPRLQTALRRFGPDLCVDVQGNSKSALISLVSGAPRRVGAHVSEWREPFAAHVMTESAPAPPPGASPHLVARALRLAAHLVPNPEPARFDPLLSPVEQEHGTALLMQEFGDDFEGTIALHPNATGDLRALPEASWTRLARSLASEGRKVLLITGPGESEVGKRLAQDLRDEEHVHHWIGQRGVRALAAVFAALAQGNGKLIACDSGPAHLAAACGLPVVLAAGPMDPTRTGPWPRLIHEAVGSREQPDCSPCRARSCRHPAGNVCMSGIEPEDLARAALRASL